MKEQKKKSEWKQTKVKKITYKDDVTYVSYLLYYMPGFVGEFHFTIWDEDYA